MGWEGGEGCDVMQTASLFTYLNILFAHGQDLCQLLFSSRLLCRGTVEDAVSRKAVQRRILADLEQQELRQQTIQDLFHPQLNDNGYLWSTEKKKKDKVCAGVGLGSAQ